MLIVEIFQKDLGGFYTINTLLPLWSEFICSVQEKRGNIKNDRAYEADHLKTFGNTSVPRLTDKMAFDT